MRRKTSQSKRYSVELRTRGWITDRILPKNITLPKSKVRVTGSDRFRQRTSKAFSRSGERNQKTGPDNHNLQNQYREVTRLVVLYILV